MKLYRWIYRSAVTGLFVTAEFAKMHPASTIKQRLWWWQKRS